LVVKGERITKKKETPGRHGNNKQESKHTAVLVGKKRNTGEKMHHKKGKKTRGKQ